MFHVEEPPTLWEKCVWCFLIGAVLSLPVATLGTILSSLLFFWMGME